MFFSVGHLEGSVGKSWSERMVRHLRWEWKPLSSSRYLPPQVHPPSSSQWWELPTGGWGMGLEISLGKGLERWRFAVEWKNHDFLIAYYIFFIDILYNTPGNLYTSHVLHLYWYIYWKDKHYIAKMTDMSTKGFFIFQNVSKALGLVLQEDWCDITQRTLLVCGNAALQGAWKMWGCKRQVLYLRGLAKDLFFLLSSPLFVWSVHVHYISMPWKLSNSTSTQPAGHRQGWFWPASLRQILVVLYHSGCKASSRRCGLGGLGWLMILMMIPR